MGENAVLTQFASAERSPEHEIKQQSELFSSSHLLRFIDNIPDIVLVLNKNRQIIYANKSAIIMFTKGDASSALGVRTGELMGCIHAHETEGGCGTTEFCKKCGAVKAILSTIRGEEDVQECRITQQESGDSIDLRVWAYPLSFEGGQYTFFIATDIGNEKRREVLERIFLHDIMNTVGNIKSFAEILKEAEANDAEEFRGLIHDLSARLIDEINAHRELIAAENKELVVHPVSVDAIALLNDIQNAFTKSEIGKKNSIQIASVTGEIEFISDRVLLTRVLSNMVKNALEASMQGDVITLGVERFDEEVQFSVHNPGFIPREIQLQIFQRSFSTKGPGRGLGTYGMRLLSERYLKGKVSFTSSEEHGTVFTARYPLVLN